jgi:hypothetical protein
MFISCISSLHLKRSLVASLCASARYQGLSTCTRNIWPSTSINSLHMPSTEIIRELENHTSNKALGTQSTAAQPQVYARASRLYVILVQNSQQALFFPSPRPGTLYSEFQVTSHGHIHACTDRHVAEQYNCYTNPFLWLLCIIAFSPTSNLKYTSPSPSPSLKPTTKAIKGLTTNCEVINYLVAGSKAKPPGILSPPVLRMTALSSVSKSSTSMFPVIGSVQYRLLVTQSSAISSVDYRHGISQIIGKQNSVETSRWKLTSGMHLQADKP